MVREERAGETECYGKHKMLKPRFSIRLVARVRKVLKMGEKR